MKKSIIYFLFALLFTTSLATFSSCREEKTTGEKIEEGVEEIEDEIDDATDDN